jgi:PGF-pre-PGF domain-containing protein
MGKSAWCALAAIALLLVLGPLGEAQTSESHTAGGYTTSLVLDMGRGKLYLGTHASPNLYVYDLVNGEPSGAPRGYPAGTTTFALILNSTQNKLYVGNGASENNLWVCDLHENGEPTGAARGYTAGSYVTCLALDVDDNKLYVGNGTAENNLWVYDLDENGELRGTPRGYTAGSNTSALALHPVLSKLYVGNDSASPSLWVYDLDNAGEPTGTPRGYSVGSNTSALALNVEHNKLYVGNATASPSLWVYDLDENGEPTGTPRGYSAGSYTTSLVLDRTRGKLYVGNGTASPNVWVYDLTGGEPAGAPSSHSAGRDTYALALDAAREKLYVGNYTETLNLWVCDMYVPPPGVPPAPTLDGLPVLTNRPSLTVAGTTEPDSRVDVYVGERVTTTKAGADGRFSVVAELREGTNAITATATNVAGTGPASPTQTVTLDTVPPPAPTVLPLPRAIALPELEVMGAAEPGSVVRVYIDNRVAGATVAENGNFSLTVILSEGQNVITARATDGAGNTSRPPSAQTVEYVRPAWAPPTPDLDELPFLVNENRLRVSGRGLAGLLVEVYVDAELVENTEVRIDNRFSAVVELHEGPNVINVVARDLLGNRSGASATQTVNVDTAMASLVVKRIGSLAARENTTMEFENLPVRRLTITAGENVGDVSVGIGELGTLPEGLPAPGSVVVYRYIKIVVNSDAGGAVFENVVIDFRVPRAWIQQNNVDENSMELLRYDGAWVPLETELVDGDAGYVYFRAEAIGSSVFAIAGEAVTEKTPEEVLESLWYSVVILRGIVITGEAMAEKTPGGVLESLWYSVAILGAAAAVVAAFAWRRKIRP